MADYIERQAAIDWFIPYIHVDERVSGETIIEDLRSLPSANVRENVQGEWITHRDYMQEKSGFYVCSVCNAMARDKSNFCPHCGAQMIGVE